MLRPEDLDAEVALIAAPWRIGLSGRERLWQSLMQNIDKPLTLLAFNSATAMRR